MASNEIPTADHDRIDAPQADTSNRSGRAATGQARSTICRAEEFLCLRVEQPMPDVWIVVDLGEVSFFGVSGLRCLIDAREAATRRGVSPHLTGADHRVVARLLEITGLRTSFDTLPTVDSVVVALNG